jgi:hypothetical protein
MDHLLIVGEFSEQWHPEVPYLQDASSPYVYDNVDMPGYPVRMGWTFSELTGLAEGKSSQIAEHTRERAASLIQAWLYFGLIHAVTRVPVDTSKYVRMNNEGRMIVCTDHLPEHMYQWQQLISRETEDEQMKYVASLDQLIQALDQVHICILHSDGALLPSEVTLSITILMRTLLITKRCMFPQSELAKESWFGNTHQMLRDQFLSKGWCEFDTQRFFQRFSSLTLYKMSTMRQRRSRRNHSSCSISHCRALHVVPKEYKTRHASIDCQCPLIGPTKSHINLLIRQGSIPVLSYSEISGLEVKSYQPRTMDEGQIPYLAISHVWADGLGNPIDNKMHRCQLKQIQERANEIATKLQEEKGSNSRPHPRSFWIDTLCVPSEAGALKRAAIAAMETVYKEASAVLVIDSDLEYVEVKASPTFAAIMIASSVWWTRLWTFQEGAFAKILYFQLQDGSTTISDLRQPSQSGNSSDACSHWSAQRQIMEDALAEFSKLSIANVRSEEGRYVIRSMSWRFTSRSSDETVCLAILLGLDVAALLKLPKDGEERMHQFIRMQKHFPSSIIFWESRAPNLKEEAFRWAPDTFLGRTSTMERSFVLRDPYRDYNLGPGRVDQAYVDGKGLHVEYFGLNLDLSKYRETNATELHLRNLTDMHRYKVALISRKDDALAPVWDHMLPLKRPMIILPRTFASRFERFLQVGLLVDVHSPEDGIELELCCNPVRRVLALREPGERTAEYEERSIGKTATAWSLNENQKWCVG